MPELHKIGEVKPMALLGKDCNYWKLSGSQDISFWEMHHNASRDLQPLRNVYGLRLAGAAQDMPRSRTGCHDLDLGAISVTLGPDSFWQTLMSEHAGIIGLGAVIESLGGKVGMRGSGRAQTAPRWVGSASWKHAIKGRPVPCNFLRKFNWSALAADDMLYWGPDAGPVIDFADFSAGTARLQPGGRDLMRETHEQFFREVFSVPAWLAPEMRSQGGVAHPWSNYIVMSQAAMINLAQFNVIQAAWLDLRHPIEPTKLISRRTKCPANYRKLMSQNVVSEGAKDAPCAYCAAPVFTNHHRCRVGCHRCWSYIMEQFNLFYYLLVARPVYVHDES
eukprot:gene6683-861_t